MIKQDTVSEGEIVVTTDRYGDCVLVTRQDEEGRILSTLYEAPRARPFRLFYEDLSDPTGFIIGRMAEAAEITYEQAAEALKAAVRESVRDRLIDYPMSRPCPQCKAEPCEDGIDALYPLNRERTKWHATCHCCHNIWSTGSTPEEAATNWNNGIYDE